MTHDISLNTPVIPPPSGYLLRPFTGVETETEFKSAIQGLLDTKDQDTISTQMTNVRFLKFYSILEVKVNGSGRSGLRIFFYFK